VINKVALGLEPMHGAISLKFQRLSILFPNSIIGESDYAGQRTSYQNGAPILSVTDALLSDELRTRIRIATRSVPRFS